MNTVLQFTTVIQINGVNPYVLVTAKQVARLQPEWRKPMPVIVQVNGKPDVPWHINMMPMGNGDFYLYLHNDVRQASGTHVGDTVEVKIWFDYGYRSGPIHAIPDRLQHAIEHNAVIAKNWSNLSPSRQKEILRYLDGLKSTDSLDRNVHKTLYVLEGNALQFMGLAWQDGK